MVDNSAFNCSETPYILDIFDDTAKNVVVMKSAQTRISMTMILRFLHRVAMLGLNGIYYFPTDDAMYPFVQSRFDPLVHRNPDLKNLVFSVNSMNLKQVGYAFAHFLGMVSKTGKESTPADHLTFDEYDLMKPEDVDIALQRVAASSWASTDRLGNPTIPDYGIHALFLLSDQKYWCIKCDHCGTRNFYLDDNRFDPEWVEQGFLACKKCRKAVDPLAGTWVAKRTGAFEFSGYQVSRLFAKNADYRRIYEDSRRAFFRQNFFNRSLGIPWTDNQLQLTAAFILKLCLGYQMPTTSFDTTAGIDQNPVAGHHVLITRPGRERLREVVHLGVYQSMDDLPQVLRKFGVKRFVIDEWPDKEGAMRLLQTFRGKGWMCDYSESMKGSYNWNDETRVVTVDRTESLDVSQRVLRESLVGLPLRSPVVEVFAEHCANVAKVLEKNEKTGVVKSRYIELGAGKPDHFRHAWNYDVMNWYHGQEYVAPASAISVQPNIRELLKKELR